MNNKFVWLFIMLVTATGLIFAGCNEDPYKNMKLVVEQASIEITLVDEDVDDDLGGQEPNEGEDEASEEVFPNVAFINAHIENDKEKQSKRILFDVVDKSIAKIDSDLTRVEDGKYQVAIRALKAGSTYVTVMSLEGNRVQRVKLTVIEPITAMAFDPSLSVAVAVGETYQFNTSALNYEPVTTNQKDVTFSLETPVDGVSITEDGTLEVTSQPNNNLVTVIAQSTAKPELTASVQVYVYTKLADDKIHLKNVRDGTEITDKITIGKNSSFNNVNIQVAIDGASEQYIAYAKVDDLSAIKVERAQGVTNSNLEFKVTGIEQSTVQVTFEIGILGFNRQTYITKTLTVEILDLVDSIYVNGSSTGTTVTVFDKYDNGSEFAYGTKMLIELSPTNASVKNVTFSASNADVAKLNRLEFYTSTGQSINDILEYKMANSGIIYVKLKDGETFEEFNCTLNIEANKDFSEDALVTNKVNIRVKEGIRTLAFAKEGQDVYINLSNNDYQEYNYYVNGILVTETTAQVELSGFDLSANKIMIQKSNVLSAKLVNGRLFVKPLSVGSTTLSLRAPNGMTATTQISVVVPTEEVVIDVDKIANKDVIASVERDDNNILTKINANVNSMFSLEMEKSTANGTIWDLTYTSNRPSVASVSSTGTVRTLYSGTATITVSFSHTVIDEISGTITKVSNSQEIEIFVFKPITTFDIGKESASVYDINSVGYFEAREYSSVAFEVRMNDCYISKNNIRMYIKGETFDTTPDSYTIEGNNGILIYEGDGVATFYAKLKNDAYSSAEAQIVAVIEEFDRTYTSVCTIKILKAPQTVEEVILYNVDTYQNGNDTYYTMNFKAGLGLGVDTDNNQQIVTAVSPKNVVNSKLYYFAYDDSTGNTKITSDTKESTVIKVTQDGVVYPLTSGQAKIIIVPRDKLNKFDNNGDVILSSNEILANLIYLQNNGSKKYFKEIVVKVADGTIENPYAISNAQDYLSIATGLSDHYVLTQSVDLSSVNLSALGTEETPFTGSISGKYCIKKPTAENPDGVYVESKLFGIKLQATNVPIPSSITALNLGLFGVVKSSASEDMSEVYPSFSNITFEINKIDVSCFSLGTTNTAFNIGLLAGKFSGEMTNVNVVLRGNCEINLTSSFGSVNIGAFAGEMGELVCTYINQAGDEESKTFTSVLNNCKIYGNGSIKVETNSQSVKVGGYVGMLQANTKILGNYVFVNEEESTTDTFQFSFNAQENDGNVKLSVDVDEGASSAVGGLVGHNLGTIQKMAVGGTISTSSANNVGAVAGINEATIENVYSATVVLGNNNVGGIVGYNKGGNAVIKLAVYESYEDGSSYVSGNDAVGGVVGQMDGGALTYVSSASFITSENKYAVKANARVGGLVGFVKSGTISTSYSNTIVAIDASTSVSGKYAGGFVGQYMGGTINSSYSITDVFKFNSGTSVTLGGFFGNSQNTATLKYCYSVSNLNNFVGYNTGSIMGQSSYYAGTAGNIGMVLQKSTDDLKKESTFTSWDFIGTFAMNSTVNQGYPYLKYKNNDFIAVVPTDLEVTIKETVDNEFVKVDDKRALLLIQKNASSSDYGKYDIKDLVDLQVSPTTNRVVRIKATVVDGSDVIRIDGGEIIILKEGYAKIKIASQLNETVYDEIEIFTTYGLKSFSNDMAVDDDNKKNVSILLNTSQEIIYTFDNGSNIVGEKFGIAYTGVDTYAYTSFNYAEVEEIDDKDYSFVDYNYSKIINAVAVCENETMLQYAYIKANFGGENVKVLLPWTKSEFNVSVYNGATDLRLDKSTSTIYPSQTAQVVASITSDLAEEFVSSVEVKCGNSTVEEFTITLEEGLTPSKDAIAIECSNTNALFSLSLIDFEFDGAEISMKFEIEPTSELHFIENQQTYTFNFAVQQNKFKKQFNLVLLPQKVERITMLHFPDGNLREDEVAVDRISSGIKGLMKINVYPDFSQIDYLEITSNTVLNENITFVQQYEQGGDFVRLYPDSVQIDNGIRLRLVSYKGNDGYVFDGNVYVSTLIRSNMPEDTPFVVTITAIKDGEAVYTYEKTLYTQFSPSVVIKYNEKYANQVARGVTLDVPLQINTMPGTITLSVEEYDGDNTFISFTSTQTKFNTKFTGEITAQLFASIHLDAGMQFKIRVQLDTVVDNVKISVADEMVVTVVDYIITGVSIEDSVMETSGSYKLTIYLSRASNLKAKVNAIYATLPSGVSEESTEGKKYLEIVDKIKKFEQTITKQNGKTGVNVWYNGKTSAGIENAGSFDSMSGKTDYFNYYYSSDDGCYKIYGSRIGAVPVISLYVAYYFDGIGNTFAPKLVDLNGQLPQDRTIFYKQVDCLISVENESTEEIPLPVYSTEEFLDMQPDAHYILMNDIELSAYTPMDANFASLDGNGYIIKVKSFALDTEQSSINVGLFASVASGTVIKNVVLDINALLNGGDSTNTFELTGIGQVNFGLFAGTNAGIITNCDVINITELVSDAGKMDERGVNKTLTINTSLINGASYTSNYIGLFVGQNTGYITNSRVGRTDSNIGLRENVNDKTSKNNSWTGDGISLISNGIVSGFVAYNANAVSACYTKNISINNNSVIANVSYTAGFVAINDGGYISNSYSEGAKIDAQDRANLKSQGSVAGFALTNSGTISNCYTDFVIRSPSNSAGFVNENQSNGVVEYCYSTCEVYLAGGVIGDNASFRPFTGVNDFNEIQNEGTISYSYYLKATNATVFADESAIAISEENKAKQSEYVGFAFVDNEKLRAYGIWTFDTALARPVLTSANQVAVSLRTLAFDADSQQEAIDKAQENNGVLIYSYKNGYELGSEINPFLINTAEKFNNLFKGITTFGTKIIVGDQINEDEVPETKFIRVISDLNFGATSETVDGLNSSKVTFSAVLDGNNMLLNSISLSGEKTTGQTEFGMFKRIDGALIKNIRMQFSEVTATEIPMVGALAGVANDSIILGVKVLGEGNFVQGKNIVGGLLGIAHGSCEIQTISSNVSVRATYRKGSGATQFTDLVYEKTGDGSEVTYTGTSYAGGIIGAVLSTDEDAMVVRTLQVYGAISVGAEQTGGVVAINYGKLYDVNFVVSISESSKSKQELSGDNTVGGLVGINYGSLDKTRLTYEGDDLVVVDKLSEGVSGGKTNLFIGSSNYVGGLVGKNMAGKITDSYNRVNVTNINAEYAGGIAGYVKGGEFSSIYTTSNVNAKTAFGSAFGYLDKNVVTTTINKVEKQVTETISVFNNIVLLNNYSTAVSQTIRGGATAGVVAGYVNADYITDVFEAITISSNYAVSNLPLNTSGTSYQKLNYFGSVKFDKMEIAQDEYSARLNDFNAFTATKNGTSVQFSWFDTTDDFADASYTTLFKNRSGAFLTYDDNDWTKETSTFPLLKITTQATEIIITDDNKSELLALLDNNPNATFVIKCDIKLYTYADGGDLDGDWVSLGTKISPFGGKFLGQKITVTAGNGQKVERLPIIEIKDTFIDYCRSTTVSNLTFILSIPNAEDKYENEIDDFYFGSIANYAENSSFSGLTLEQGTAPISVTGNRTYNEDEAVPKNCVGGVVGYASGSVLSGIDFMCAMSVTLQTGTNTVIPSYIGGIVGYCVLSDVLDVDYKVSYTEYMDGKAYSAFNVTSGNASVGGIGGYVNSSKLKSINISEVKGNEIGNALPNGSAVVPMSVNLLARDVEGSLTFGGVVGGLYSTTLVNVELNLTNIEQTATDRALKTIISGAVVGEAFSSILTSVTNFANISLTNATTNDTYINELFVGGVVGRLRGSSDVANTQNLANVLVSGKSMTQTTGYVGGLVGAVICSSMTSSITESRNVGAVTATNLYVAQVGGLLGRVAVDVDSATNQGNCAIKRSYSESYVTVQSSKASEENVGGLVGFANRISVENTYAVGSAISKTTNVENEGSITVGGFIGRLHQAGVQPSLAYCYSATIVKVYADPLKTKVYSKAFIGYTSLTTEGANSVVFGSCYYVGEFAQANDVVKAGYTQSMHDYTANFVSYYSMLSAKTFNNFSISTSASDTSKVFIMVEGKTLPILTKFYGTTANALGSVYQPYKISSSEELRAFTTDTGNGADKYYVQTKTIYVSSVETRLEFNGVFDGGNFEIVGLVKPLFGTINESAVVSAVNVQQLDITATVSGNYGAIAKTNYGTILFSSADGSITFTSSCNSSAFGGLVAENYGHIGFSSSDVEITQTNNGSIANTFVGGLVGKMDKYSGEFSQISNSFATGTLTLRQVTGDNFSSVGGLVGNLIKGNLQLCYSAGRVNYLNATSVKAYGAVFANENGGDQTDAVYDEISLSFVYNDRLATLLTTVETDISDITMAYIMENGLPSGFDSYAWSSFKIDYDANSKVTMLNYGYPYLKYASQSVAQIKDKGTGNDKTPFLIKNQSSFEIINAFETNKKKYTYQLDDDIYCVSGSFIDVLTGTLVGNSKTIYNVEFEVSANAKSGFVNTNKGTISNIAFVSPKVSIVSTYAGTAVGIVSGLNSGTISNVNIQSGAVTYATTSSAPSTRVEMSLGGLVGENSGVITKSNINGLSMTLRNTHITGSANLGGFVGKNLSGGTIGADAKTFDSSVNNLTINAGGTSKISSNVYKKVGGFVGYLSGGTITNCQVSGGSASEIRLQVSGTGNKLGGFAGQNGTDGVTNTNPTIISCKSNINLIADVNSGAYLDVGAICGYTQWVIKNPVITKHITVNGSTTHVNQGDFVGSMGGKTGLVVNGSSV